MNKQSKSWLSKLIPVVAILVLAESLMLIMKLNDTKSGSVGNVANETMPTETISPENETSYAVAIVPESEEMTLGKTQAIEVKAMANDERSLDSINVYLAYDPEAFTVSNLTFDSKLPKPTFSKISDTKGLIVATYLISEADGLKVDRGEELSLMKFTVKPLKEGNFNFEISTGNDSQESATMFVESATSKVLPFSSNKLTVTVTK